MARNRVIGRANALPWHLPDDLQRFKSLTLGKPIVMGRRTFESIGRPLPGRVNIVLTRSADPLPATVRSAASWSDVQGIAEGAPEICVIGGAQVYAESLPFAARIHLTEVHADIDGDTWFPPLEAAIWSEIQRIEHAADERHAHAMSFVTLERLRAPQESVAAAG